MKIAFIMLCHKNPDQINRLVDKLLEFHESDVFIHVDAKHSELQKSIRSCDRVFVINPSESYCIKWGSVNIIKATLLLIRKVVQTGKVYDYIWLISGQDYPICSAKKIEERLSERPGMNYIETILPGDQRYNTYRKRCELLYPSWINENNVMIKSFKRIYMILTGGYDHTFTIFRRNKPFCFDFIFGSQWWTLTADAAFDILKYCDRNPDFIKYFEKCIVPDECFFQTLFMMGPYKKFRETNLVFVNWGKNRRSPELLTISDMKGLLEKANDFLFARKFDIDKSNSLMDAIDAIFLR